MPTAHTILTAPYTALAPPSSRKFSPENLQGLRKRKGYSRRQLGDRIGKGQLTISAYEQGRCVPSTAAIGRLAAALGCPIDALFSNEALPDAT